MVLDAQSQIPLYLQLADLLRQEIDHGTYKYGEQLPTEQELSQTYNISRVTVRNALGVLHRENLLERQQGRGTFVATEKIGRKITEITSLSDICAEMGKQCKAKVLKCMLEPATPEDIETLKLPEQSYVVAMERIRYVDGEPILVEYSRFPQTFSFLLQEDMTDVSLLHLLKEKYNIEFSVCRKVMELTFASYPVSQYLEVEENYPLISLQSFSTLEDGTPAHSNLQLLLGDRFRFYV